MVDADIQLFSDPDFGCIRTIELDGKILFCAKDVASALGYSNTNDAVLKHCRGVAKRYPINDQLGRSQQARFVEESDVYRLIANSRLPLAEKFEKWIFEDIVPSVARTGVYKAPSIDLDKMFSDPDTVLALVENWKRDRERANLLQAENEKMAPKAFFADSVSNSESLILVRDLAHILRQNGLDIGERRLFARLREDGYIEKHRNEPTQRSLDLGVLRVIEGSYTKPDGTTMVTRTVKVTGKGQVYFVNKYVKAEVA